LKNNATLYTQILTIGDLNMRALFLTFALLLTGCGGGTDTIEDVQTCRKIEMFGDSITLQAKHTIAEFLPCYTIVNHGRGGSMAGQIALPSWDKETVYTVSYGANECLQHVSIAQYRASIVRILEAGRGYRIVLEAPWRLTNPKCSPQVENFRQVVVELGALYNVPVAELDMNQDHDGGGIHLRQPHAILRAQLLAAAVLKNN
jgi:hypothetical protein